MAARSLFDIDYCDEYARLPREHYRFKTYAANLFCTTLQPHGSKWIVIVIHKIIQVGGSYPVGFRF